MINFLFFLMVVIPFICVGALQLWLCFHITKFVFKLIPTILSIGLILLFLFFNAAGIFTAIIGTAILFTVLLLLLPIFLAWVIFWLIS